MQFLLPVPVAIVATYFLLTMWEAPFIIIIIIIMTALQLKLLPLLGLDHHHVGRVDIFLPFVQCISHATGSGVSVCVHLSVEQKGGKTSKWRERFRDSRLHPVPTIPPLTVGFAPLKKSPGEGCHNPHNPASSFVSLSCPSG
jgi:hypothetical protein